MHTKNKKQLPTTLYTVKSTEKNTTSVHSQSSNMDISGNIKEFISTTGRQHKYLFSVFFTHNRFHRHTNATCLRHVYLTTSAFKIFIIQGQRNPLSRTFLWCNSDTQ